MIWIINKEHIPVLFMDIPINTPELCHVSFLCENSVNYENIEKLASLLNNPLDNVMSIGPSPSYPTEYDFFHGGDTAFYFNSPFYPFRMNICYWFFMSTYIYQEKISYEVQWNKLPFFFDGKNIYQPT